MKFGFKTRLESQSQDFRSLFENALREVSVAEKVGFESAWVGEIHQSPIGFSTSPLMMLASYASVTRKMSLGVSILLLPLYNPLRLAEDAASVDIISGGRLILGVGIGSPLKKLYDSYGVPTRRVGSRLEEAITLVKRFWCEDNVSYEGDYYKCKDVSMSPKPLQKPYPPVWIGTEPGNEKGLRRAALLGDSWIPSSVYDIGTLKQDFEFYNKCLREAGKPEDRNRIVQRDLFISRNTDEAMIRAEPILKKLYNDVYLKIGFQIRSPLGKIIEIEKDGFDKFRDGRFIIGGPDQCIQEIERYVKSLAVNHLVTRISFPGMNHEEVLDTIRLLGEKVIPYFKGN